MVDVETKQRPIEIWAGLIGFAGLASILWVLGWLTSDDYEQPEEHGRMIAPAVAPQGAAGTRGAVTPEPAAATAPAPGH